MLSHVSGAAHGWLCKDRIFDSGAGQPLRLEFRCSLISVIKLSQLLQKKLTVFLRSCFFQLPLSPLLIPFPGLKILTNQSLLPWSHRRICFQESHMDCALMVTGAALEAITQESLMEDCGLVTWHFEVGEIVWFHAYIIMYYIYMYLCM